MTGPDPVLGRPGVGGWRRSRSASSSNLRSSNGPTSCAMVVVEDLARANCRSKSSQAHAPATSSASNRAAGRTSPRDTAPRTLRAGSLQRRYTSGFGSKAEVVLSARYDADDLKLNCALARAAVTSPLWAAI